MAAPRGSWIMELKLLSLSASRAATSTTKAVAAGTSVGNDRGRGRGIHANREGVNKLLLDLIRACASLIQAAAPEPRPPQAQPPLPTHAPLVSMSKMMAAGRRRSAGSGGWKGCCCCCSRLRPHSSAKAHAAGSQVAAAAAAAVAAAAGASVWSSSAGSACCCTAAAGGAWALTATCWAGAAGCEGAGVLVAAALCCGSNFMPLLPFNCCCAACWRWMGARRAVLQH
jgi:hypothetical protein